MLTTELFIAIINLCVSLALLLVIPLVLRAKNKHKKTALVR